MLLYPKCHKQKKVRISSGLFSVYDISEFLELLLLLIAEYNANIPKAIISTAQVLTNNIDN
jgi:hypothetical protein